MSDGIHLSRRDVAKLLGVGAAFSVGGVGLVLLAALAVSTAYVALRKPLVRVAELVVGALPASVLGHVPERFLDGLQ